MRRNLTFRIYSGETHICTIYEASRIINVKSLNSLQLINYEDDVIGFISIDTMKHKTKIFNKFVLKKHNVIDVIYTIQL